MTSRTTPTAKSRPRAIGALPAWRAGTGGETIAKKQKKRRSLASGAANSGGGRHPVRLKMFKLCGSKVCTFGAAVFEARDGGDYRARTRQMGGAGGWCRKGIARPRLGFRLEPRCGPRVCSQKVPCRTRNWGIYCVSFRRGAGMMIRKSGFLNEGCRC